MTHQTTQIADLKKAISHDELLLFFQPQFNLSLGRIVGVEALVRWNHPKQGLVPPDHFIPLAEKKGIMPQLGIWVLEKAIAQSQVWREIGLPEIRMGINLSVSQLESPTPDLLQRVTTILAETGLPPTSMDFEITESLPMRNFDDYIPILEKLANLGVSLSIDDFGTGYTSLNCLKKLPVQALKIDHSYIQELTLDPRNEALVLSIIRMAHSLNLRVVAEGVETEEQWQLLKVQRCEEVQGFYFSKPLPAKEATELLLDHYAASH